MRHLLNTLYVMTEDSYLSLDNENIVVNGQNKILGKYPLKMFEKIMYFGYKGASPALMGECAERGIGMSFFRPSGRFLARVCGESSGNVLLRRQQYRMADDKQQSCMLARCFVTGKLYNSRSVLERGRRDHALSLDAGKLSDAGNELLEMSRLTKNCTDLDELRGYEGDGARAYFSVLDELILQNKNYFSFSERTRRPPKNPTNAMLSFAYTLLANDCASALEGVGLDAYVGFMHRDRPGRISLALDLMEELRSIYADRFVLTLINNRIMNGKSFDTQDSGTVIMKDAARRSFLQLWQERKKDIITHPFIGEKLPWGLVPFVQAQLLARYIRGDLEEYPCFLWK